MQVFQTPSFAKSVKKLHANQKKALDAAVHAIMQNPYLGEAKKGELAHIRVHKFNMNQQLTLLAYSYVDETLILTLLALSSHENFYRDLKH